MYQKRCSKCRFWQKDEHSISGVCSLHSNPWTTYKDTERLRKQGGFDNRGYLRTKYYESCQDFESVEQ